jgi:RHS repeat-associated protein
VITTYDARNRATSITGLNAADETTYSYQMFYDAVGNLKQSIENHGTVGGLGTRTVDLSYDNANRLVAEQESGTGGSRLTTHGYDAANNRTSKSVSGVGGGTGSWTFTYNALNQLVSSTTPQGAFSYSYDLKGNRTTRSKTGGETTHYSYDSENRLKTVGGQYQGQPLSLSYLYDYRNRRILRDEPGDNSATVVFSGGTSVQEWTATTSNCTSCHSPILQTEYVRGSDMGGGVGGLLYSLRPSQPIGFTHYNHRGDVVAKTNGAGTLTWQAAYEAFGTRRAEFGTTPDRQKANTKEEDPSGLINEGHRYRDLETGVFITKDPAGFIDGPNLYAYVRQNPWSKFDPEGLFEIWGFDFRAEDLEHNEPLRDLGGFLYGTAIGTKKLAVGVGNAVANPIDTVDGVFEGIGKAVDNGIQFVADLSVDPSGTSARVSKEVSKSVADFTANPDTIAEKIGEALPGIEAGIATGPILGKTTGVVGEALASNGSRFLPHAVESGGVLNPLAKAKLQKAAANGRNEHAKFRAKVQAKKGWKSEPRLIDPKTGKTVIPDAVTPSGKPVELKPDTPSGVKRGNSQMKKYERATGKSGRVVYH